MGKSKRSLTISLILILVSLSYLGAVIFQHRAKYLDRFDYEIYKKKYEQSQWGSPYAVPESKNLNEWAISKGYQGWTEYVDQVKNTVDTEKVKAQVLKERAITPISDEELYSFAASQYIQGKNPVLVNPEVPPLPKYLMGLSILLFGNQNVFNLIAGFASLVLIFYLLKKLTGSLLIASIGLFLTVFTTSFTEQLMHVPQLDIFQLFFFLAFLLTYVRFFDTGKNSLLILAGLSFGGFIGIKFFLFYWVILNLSLLIFYLLKKIQLKKMISHLGMLNLIGLLFYLLSYFRYFMIGGNLRGFLGVQKWIWLFYSQTKIDMTKLFGNYLNLIFFNKWTFWYNGYPVYPYQYWNIFWPVIFLAGIFSIYMLFLRSRDKERGLALLLTGFFLVYNLFLFAVPVYPRYLLLLFVPLNILIALYFGRRIEAVLKRL